MNQIRKEYKNYKLITEQQIKETENWLSENVIFINERIDRTTLKRLNSSIARFEEKFGPYRSKLPAIAKVLADAEKGLYVVITGNTSKKSAIHMLERMSMLYNIFSDFFSKDLGMLLTTPVFRSACSNPESALNAIEHPEHNHKMIKRCLAAALKPDAKEKDIFNRVYKNIPMPTMNWHDAAKQLMSLSVSDLRKLCEIEKVPGVVVADVEPDTLQEQIIRDIEQRPEFQNLQRQITQMIQLADEYRMDQRVIDSMIQMSDDLIDLIRNQSLGSKIGDVAASIFTLGIKDSTIRRLLKQSITVVQTFAVLKNVWEQNKDFFKVRLDGGMMSSRDKDALEKLFDRALERAGWKPGAVSRLFGRLDVTRTAPYPGLEPETLRNEFIKYVEKQFSRGSNEQPRNTFKITYDENGAAGAPERLEDVVRRGDKIRKLPGKGSMTWPGREFAGWFTQPIGGERVRDLRGGYEPTRNITLYARWTGAAPLR